MIKSGENWFCVACYFQGRYVMFRTLAEREKLLACCRRWYKKFEGGQRNRSFHPFSVIIYRIHAAACWYGVSTSKTNFNYLLKEREGNIRTYVHLCFIRFLLLLSGFTFSYCLIRSLCISSLFIFFLFSRFLTRGDVRRFRREKLYTNPHEELHWVQVTNGTLKVPSRRPTSYRLCAKKINK